MALHNIFFIIGIFLTSIAIAMIAPIGIDLYDGHSNSQAFVLAMSVTLFIGLLLTFGNRPAQRLELSLRDTFILTALSWLIIPLFTALPFYLSNLQQPFIDALFEAVSGLTTTGASVIVNIDKASDGFILWRAILQWLGGIGIVVMALTVMPALRIGGMQLFRNEFSDRSEKLHPKLSQVTRYIFAVYCLLTFSCALMLWLAGMPGFEALCHAFSTLSTGGFMTFNGTMGYYNDAIIEAILMFYMICGATTLLLFVRFFQRDYKSLINDAQVRCFLKIIFWAILGMTLWHYNHGVSSLKALWESSFMVISMITTTGFSTDNYTLWGGFSTIVIIILTQIGGCTGSTSGSIKVFRYQIFAAVARSYMALMRRPHGIFIARYNDKQIPVTVLISVFTFFGLYMIILCLLSLGLSLFGYDSSSCCITAVGILNNNAIVVNSISQLTNNFAHCSFGVKMLLMIGMILGRLEYLTIIILFQRRFWQN